MGASAYLGSNGQPGVLLISNDEQSFAVMTPVVGCTNCANVDNCFDSTASTTWIPDANPDYGYANANVTINGT
jgi:hypothetical protein